MIFTVIAEKWPNNQFTVEANDLGEASAKALGILGYTVVSFSKKEEAK